jgi:protein involved in polysaccharide export with SLBB domain
MASALLVALVLCASSCKSSHLDAPPLDPPPVAEGAPQVRQPSVNDTIQIGERLELFVEEDPTLNGVYVVREKGDLIVPRLGRVDVKGMSVSSVERKFKDLLEKSLLRNATVIVDRVGRVAPQDGLAGSAPQEQPKLFAYFTGQVKRPGQHWIVLPRGQPVGIYEAILISGGLQKFANDRKVEILRRDENGNSTKLELDLRAVKDGEAPDPPLYEGDIVFVPEKLAGL